MNMYSTLKHESRKLLKFGLITRRTEETPEETCSVPRCSAPAIVKRITQRISRRETQITRDAELSRVHFPRNHWPHGGIVPTYGIFLSPRVTRAPAREPGIPIIGIIVMPKYIYYFFFHLYPTLPFPSGALAVRDN